MEGAAGSGPPLSAGRVWKLSSVFLGARGSRQWAYYAETIGLRSVGFNLLNWCES